MKRLLRIFASGLKIAGTAAPSIVGLVYPPLGGILNSIVEQVLKAEANVGPGNGSKKRDQVLDMGRAALPFIVALIEHQTGRDIDDDQVIEAYGKITDGVVQFMNATGALPKA